MKTGVVDVGGGMRGIYAAGILDFCLRQGIHFDCCVGVSAGSANMASYLAGQQGRNRRFYLDYAFRKEYMSLGNLLRRGSYVDLDYVYGVLSRSGGEDPLDYEAMAQNPAELVVVAEEAVSGRTRYFTKADVRQDDYRIFMASSALPGVNRPYEIGGTAYFDGALADPVPVRKAFDLDCDRVVLILTRPADQPRAPGKDPAVARLIRRRYPSSARQLLLRAQRYNDGVELARRYEAEGRLLLLAPDRLDGMSTLARDREALERFYQKGTRDAEQICGFLAR